MEKNSSKGCGGEALTLENSEKLEATICNFENYITSINQIKTAEAVR